MTAPQPLTGSLDLPRGTALGKYEILRKLATGGMAEIYLARVRGTAGFEKLVVLKRILPTVAQDPAFVQMFLEEARLAATLQHPHIADVYDVGECDGAYFFTMEYIHGEDARSIRFATRKRGERPPLAIALAIIQGTASALDYAHNKTGPKGPLGLVHRDISSSNILVSYDGAVKLVDFGIARATAHESKTRTGTLKGKIPYMSPEQCRAHPLDRRSDLFSLGVVLYELTVGRRPFRGEGDFQIMEQIVRYDAKPPTSIDAEYPPALEAIVLRLLARELDARYQSADELLHDLEAFMAQHQLWASPNMVGKYMRGLFPDKVRAWQDAADVGVSLGQFVAHTVTSESQQSNLLTPPSVSALHAAVLPVAPPPRSSAPMPVPVLGPTTGSMPAPSPSGRSGSSVTAYPEIRPRRRGLVIGLAAVGTLAAAALGLVATRGDLDEPPVSSPTASGAAPADPRPPMPDPPATTPATPEPGPVAVPAPEKARSTVTTPAAGEPVAGEPVAGEPVAAEPVAGEPTESAARPKPSAARPTTPKPSKPSKPTKPSPTKPKPKPTKPDDKEAPWDPNSPFLPPS